MLQLLERWFAVGRIGGILQNLNWRLTWDLMAPWLEERFRLILPDNRAVGQTGMPV